MMAGTWDSSPRQIAVVAMACLLSVQWFQPPHEDKTIGYRAWFRKLGLPQFEWAEVNYSVNNSIHS